MKLLFIVFYPFSCNVCSFPHQKTAAKDHRQQQEGTCYEWTTKEKQKKHGKYILLKGK